MNKVLVFAVSVVAIGLLFSCSSPEEDKTDSSSSGGSPLSSSPNGGASSSSSLPLSSSSNDEVSSSSSLPSDMVFCELWDGTCLSTPIPQEECYMFDGVPVQSCAESSSSNDDLSSSSLSDDPLTCGTLPSFGYVTSPIAPPALTCKNGETAASIRWLGAPAIDWDNPIGGTYSDIKVMADCGTETDLMASCSGTLTVRHVLSCNMPDIGYTGEAIEPMLACSDGSKPSGIVFSGYLPNWDNLAVGSYAVFAEANCGQGVLPKISCGTLTVNPATLTCGSVPASGTSNIAITPPALTCNNGRTPTNITWSANAPNWNNPAIGTYSNISTTAACGGVSGLTANCSGSLSVTPCSAKEDNTPTHYCSEGTMKQYVILTDTRDNKTYKTVVIGTQTWMAENLNYNATGSRCYGDNTGGDSQNKCGTYGRLYDWSTARTVCPTGWHLPSKAEWEVMTNFIGGAGTEGKKLKATSGWGNNGNGTDDYGFSALPGGHGSWDGSFDGDSYWWSASECASASECENYNYGYPFSRHMDHDYAYWIFYGKSDFHSVRCLKD